MKPNERYENISKVITSFTEEEFFDFFNKWTYKHHHTRTPKMKDWENLVLIGIVSELVDIVEERLNIDINPKEQSFIESLYRKFLKTNKLLETSKHLEWN